jgi:hypothetical protein
MKKLNQSTNQFVVWLFIMVLTAFTGVAQPPAPAAVSIQAKDTDRAVVRWSLSEGATAYKVLLSEDSITFTEAATVGADTIFAHVPNLISGTTYNVHVVASNAEGASAPTAAKFTTIVPELKIHIPLDTLNAEGHIVEAISSATVAPAATGQLVVQDAATSGLGIPAIRFVQDELEGIASWVDITSFIKGNEINTNLMSRTFLTLDQERESILVYRSSFHRKAHRYDHRF